MYHYHRGIFARGTHYIFMESTDDQFPVEALGSMGSVLAHGGTSAYHRIRKGMQSGSRAVLLYNSGGVTQAFSSVLRTLVNHPEISVSTVASKHVDIVSNENWAQTFGVPEIVMMKELDKRAPLLYKKAIVTVDIVEDSAEHVLHTMTGTLHTAHCTLYTTYHILRPTHCTLHTVPPFTAFIYESDLY
jgi:hypothetical protein